MNPWTVGEEVDEVNMPDPVTPEHNGRERSKHKGSQKCANILVEERLGARDSRARCGGSACARRLCGDSEWRFAPKSCRSLRACPDPGRALTPRGLRAGSTARGALPLDADKPSATMVRRGDRWT